jgi:hypothetical protein
MNTRSEASAPVIDEGVVERAKDAMVSTLILLKRDIGIDAIRALARAALEAGCAGLVAENARLREALEGCDAYFEALEHCGNEKHPAMRKMIRTAFRGDRERGEG